MGETEFPSENSVNVTQNLGKLKHDSSDEDDNPNSLVPKRLRKNH